jgi:hypothetical protein
MPGTEVYNATVDSVPKCLAPYRRSVPSNCEFNAFDRHLGPQARPYSFPRLLVYKSRKKQERAFDPKAENHAEPVGRFRCMASAVTSVYFRPAPVLKTTTRSSGFRKPVAMRFL